MGDKDLQKRYSDQLKGKTAELDKFIQSHPELKRDYVRTRVKQEYVATNKNSNEIPDGLSKFDKTKMGLYDKLLPVSQPENLFDKIKPATKLNPHDQELTVAEIDFIHRAENAIGKVDIIPTQQGIKPTNDFGLIGCQRELKTPVELNDMTIRNDIWKITDQNKRNAILDVTFLDKKMSWIFDKIDKHFSIPKNQGTLDSVIVVRGNKFIYIDMK